MTVKVRASLISEKTTEQNNYMNSSGYNEFNELDKYKGFWGSLKGFDLWFGNFQEMTGMKLNMTHVYSDACFTS